MAGTTLDGYHADDDSLRTQFGVDALRNDRNQNAPRYGAGSRPISTSSVRSLAYGTVAPPASPAWQQVGTRPPSAMSPPQTLSLRNAASNGSRLSDFNYPSGAGSDSDSDLRGLQRGGAGETPTEELGEAKRRWTTIAPDSDGDSPSTSNSSSLNSKSANGGAIVSVGDPSYSTNSLLHQLAQQQPSDSDNAAGGGLSLHNGRAAPAPKKGPKSLGKRLGQAFLVGLAAGAGAAGVGFGLGALGGTVALPVIGTVTGAVFGAALGGTIGFFTFFLASLYTTRPRGGKAPPRPARAVVAPSAQRPAGIRFRTHSSFSENGNSQAPTNPSRAAAPSHRSHARRSVGVPPRLVHGDSPDEASGNESPSGSSARSNEPRRGSSTRSQDSLDHLLNSSPKQNDVDNADFAFREREKVLIQDHGRAVQWYLTRYRKRAPAANVQQMTADLKEVTNLNHQLIDLDDTNTSLSKSDQMRNSLQGKHMQRTLQTANGFLTTLLNPKKGSHEHLKILADDCAKFLYEAHLYTATLYGANFTPEQLEKTLKGVLLMTPLSQSPWTPSELLERGMPAHEFWQATQQLIDAIPLNDESADEKGSRFAAQLVQTVLRCAMDEVGIDSAANTLETNSSNDAPQPERADLVGKLQQISAKSADRNLPAASVALVASLPRIAAAARNFPLPQVQPPQPNNASGSDALDSEDLLDSDDSRNSQGTENSDDSSQWVDVDGTRDVGQDSD